MARAPATRTGRAGCPLATRVPSAWRGSTAASRAVGRIKSSRFHPSGPPANLIRGRSMRTFLTWSSPLRSGSSLSARSSRSASKNGPDHGARSVISRSRMVTLGDGRRWTRRLLAVTLRFSSWLARLVRIPRYRSWSRRSGPARSTMTSPPKTRSNPRSQRRPRLITLPAPSRLLSLESREKQLAHHLWIGLAATGLHHHADQKGETLYLPFPVVGDRPGMFGKHLLNNLEQRVLVGDLGQPLLLHDQLGRFPSLIHLLKDCFGDLAADTSAFQQPKERSQLGRRDRAVGNLPAILVQVAQEFDHHPVTGELRLLAALRNLLVVVGKRPGCREDRNIVVRDPILPGKPRATLLREFGQGRADLVDPLL